MDKLLVNSTPISEMLVNCPLYRINKKERIKFLLNRIRKGKFISTYEIQEVREAFRKVSNDLVNLTSGKVKCYLCSGIAKHRHHVIPICRGGKNVVENLVPLCIPCHKFIDKHRPARDKDENDKVLNPWILKDFKSPLSKVEKIVVIPPGGLKKVVTKKETIKNVNLFRQKRNRKKTMANAKTAASPTGTNFSEARHKKRP